ncbi:hypothetical protein FG386_002902 [Cryptosporidium ryanae]|uniref:uncharacterized protein n=1 Tax=Cryptosporidium ryanae TaxID=515981 RepID=UPI003519E212|nr:hypothetical protein FG386_002902 [Cryptosporidium ryanae]
MGVNLNQELKAAKAGGRVNNKPQHSPKKDSKVKIILESESSLSSNAGIKVSKTRKPRRYNKRGRGNNRKSTPVIIFKKCTIINGCNKCMNIQEKEHNRIKDEFNSKNTDHSKHENGEYDIQCTNQSTSDFIYQNIKGEENNVNEHVATNDSIQYNQNQEENIYETPDPIFNEPIYVSITEHNDENKKQEKKSLKKVFRKLFSRFSRRSKKNKSKTGIPQENMESFEEFIDVFTDDEFETDDYNTNPNPCDQDEDNTEEPIYVNIPLSNDTYPGDEQVPVTENTNEGNESIPVNSPLPEDDGSKKTKKKSLGKSFKKALTKPFKKNKNKPKTDIPQENMESFEEFIDVFTDDEFETDDYNTNPNPYNQDKDNTEEPIYVNIPLSNDTYPGDEQVPVTENTNEGNESTLIN